MSDAVVGLAVLVLVVAVVVWLGYYHRADKREGPDDEAEW